MKNILYFIIFCCAIIFLIQKHFIILLLSLEFIITATYSLFLLKYIPISGIILLSLGACERALGLSLLINLANRKKQIYHKRILFN